LYVFASKWNNDKQKRKYEYGVFRGDCVFFFSINFFFYYAQILRKIEKYKINKKMYLYLFTVEQKKIKQAQLGPFKASNIIIHNDQTHHEQKLKSLINTFREPI
jgi:hypothetical protein